MKEYIISFENGSNGLIKCKRVVVNQGYVTFLDEYGYAMYILSPGSWLSIRERSVELIKVL